MEVSPRNRLIDRESAYSVYLRRPDIVIEPDQKTEITEQQERHRDIVQLLHHISEAGGAQQRPAYSERPCRRRYAVRAQGYRFTKATIHDCRSRPHQRPIDHAHVGCSNLPRLRCRLRTFSSVPDFHLHPRLHPPYPLHPPFHLRVIRSHLTHQYPRHCYPTPSLAWAPTDACLRTSEIGR